MQRVIDCDVEVKTPKGYKLIYHRKVGKIVWDPTKIKLIPLDPGAGEISPEDRTRSTWAAGIGDPGLCPNIWKSGDALLGNAISRCLSAGLVPLNGCCLDYLAEHEDLVPGDWSDKAVLFVNTRFDGGRDGTNVVCGLAKSILAGLREWRDEKPLIRALPYWLFGFPFWAFPLSEARRKFVPRIRTDFSDCLRFMGPYYVAAYKP